jgi:hypothetical protein
VPKAVSRLTSLTHDLVSSANDYAGTFTFNPADQLQTRAIGTDVYAFAPGPNASVGYTPNGLNQYASVGGVTYGYDANGNLTSDGVTS